jgi:hypothetical protein
VESWYVNVEGRPEGPFSSDELVDRLKKSEINLSSQVYRLGDKDWSKIESHEFFVRALDFSPSQNSEFQRVEIPIVNAEWVILKKTDQGFRQLGPMTEDEVRNLIHLGDVQFSDHFWKNGMTEWQPLAQFQGLEAKSKEGAPNSALTELSEQRSSSTSIDRSEKSDKNQAELLGEILFQQRETKIVESHPEEAQTPNLAKDFGSIELNWSMDQNFESQQKMSDELTHAKQTVEEPLFSFMTDEKSESSGVDSDVVKPLNEKPRFEIESDVRKDSSAHSIAKEIFPKEEPAQRVSASIPMVEDESLLKDWDHETTTLVDDDLIDRGPSVKPEVAQDAFGWLKSKESKMARPEFLSRLVVGLGAIAVVALLMVWWLKPTETVAPVASAPIALKFGQNGLEIDVAAPKLSKQTIDLWVQGVSGQTLSKNSFDRQFRIQLDRNGSAKLRLDQWSPPEGNYRAIAKSTAGLKGAQTKAIFFIGSKPQEFKSRLEQFKEEMRTPLANPQEVKPRRKPSREAQVLYKFSRDLEEAYVMGKKNRLSWNAFIQRWSKSYLGQRNSTFAGVEKDFQGHESIIGKFKNEYDELEVLSMKMDKSIRQGGVIPMTHSKKLSEFIEQMRDVPLATSDSPVL